jgi:hypothetical protein
MVSEVLSPSGVPLMLPWEDKVLCEQVPSVLSALI